MGLEAVSASYPAGSVGRFACHFMVLLSSSQRGERLACGECGACTQSQDCPLSGEATECAL